MQADISALRVFIKDEQAGCQALHGERVDMYCRVTMDVRKL